MAIGVGTGQLITGTVTPPVSVLKPIGCPAELPGF